MPEVAPNSAPTTVVRAKRSQSLLSITSTAPEIEDEDGDGKQIRSTEDKQRLLGRYLNNVEDLVQDLRESTLFGV